MAGKDKTCALWPLLKVARPALVLATKYFYNNVTASLKLTCRNIQGAGDAFEHPQWIHTVMCLEQNSFL